MRAPCLGCAMVGVHRYLLSSRTWRNRGLAHALIIETLREFKSRGMTESALNADTENLSGAFQLYESLGFRTVKTTTVYQKPIGSP